MDAVAMSTTEQLVAAVAASTDQLASRIALLGDSEVRAPCALPGWSRGHLLTHLARNADGLRRAILAIRSGEAIPMYASTASRDADIDAGAGRPTRVIIDDFALSAYALATEVDLVTPDQWRSSTQLSTVTGPSTVPAQSLLEMRLREVEIHHVDLAVGYDFSLTAAATVHSLIRYAAQRLSRQGPHHLTLNATDTGHTYTVLSNTATSQEHLAEAPASDLLMYLTGRPAPSGSIALPDPPLWG
ncbi:MAG: maleylpyruvate isomerase [Thermoproteota archaeon]